MFEEMFGFMLEITYKITDPRGIHARPAGRLVQLIKSFEAQCLMGRADKLVDGRHLLAVMQLALRRGDVLTLQFTGHDELQAASAVQQFLQETL